jgi:hypothetical protein
MLLVMAYISSFSIISLVISEDILRRILCQSLLDLHHLHTAHGDRPVIFPVDKTNQPVLFDGDNNVVLAGFGHASLHPPRRQFLQGNTTVSTAYVFIAFPVSRLDRP